MDKLKIAISSQTVHRRAHELGLYGRVTGEKPYLNKANQVKCLNYVKMYQDKTMVFLKHVLWSDESKYNLFGSDGKVTVWGTPKEEYDKKCRAPAVKHGGSNVNVYSCLAWNGVENLAFIEGNITGKMYKNILDENFFRLSKKLQLGRSMVFQYDNDSKHRAHMVKH